MKERKKNLFDIALETVDSVCGEGSYEEINKSNPDPRVQAAIQRSKDINTARDVMNCGCIETLTSYITDDCQVHGRKQGKE